MTPVLAHVHATVNVNAPNRECEMAYGDADMDVYTPPGANDDHHVPQSVS